MLEMGREQTVKVNGKSVRLGRMTLEALDLFRDFVREEEGDPFAIVDRYIDKVPKEDAVRLLREAEARAEELKVVHPGSPLGRKWLGHPRGMTRLLQGLLISGGVDEAQATEELAFGIAQEMGEKAVAEAIKKAEGEAPAAPNAEPASAG